MLLGRREAKIQMLPVGPPSVFLSRTEALFSLLPTVAPVARLGVGNGIAP